MRCGISVFSALALISACPIIAVPSLAEAHLELMQPKSRSGRNALKIGPCGATGSVRSSTVTTFRPGQTITVQWDEYVNHPGHFRISFDPDGDDGFVDPPCLAGCDTSTPTIELNSNMAVLRDGIPDSPTGGVGTATVTLPNIECTNCTLQVIQVMYDKPPYALPGDDIYYQCADLVLSANAPETPDAGTPAGLDAAVTADGGALGEADSGVLAAKPDASTPGAQDPPGRDAKPTGTVEGVSCSTSTGHARAGSALALAIALGSMLALRRLRREDD